MNRQHIIKTLLFIGLISISCASFAQKGHLHEISFDGKQGVRNGQEITFSTDITLDKLQLANQELLILMPVITAKNSDEKIKLPPVFVVGPTRAKIMEREKIYNNKRSYTEQKPLSVTVRNNGESQMVKYRTRIAYSSWMDDASLTIEEKVIGCAECEKGSERLLLSDPFLPVPYEPNYRLTYIVPAAEEIKSREDKYVATVNFHSGKHDLDLVYRNNREVLSEIEQKVAEVLNDKDLNVEDIKVIGYASPEGASGYNQKLSERRANSIAVYLAEKFRIPLHKVKVVGYGEDWKQTRKEVEQSDIPNKEEVLRIIDSTLDLDARDAKIKRLSGGKTYQEMLQYIYPRIRRTEYAFSYVVRGFDLDEAKSIIKTNPKLLSLNEMFLVAKSYPSESKEFKNVFDIAARLYPQEPVAIINASAAEIENGSYPSAIERLRRIEGDSKVWNNLGIAYALMGDYQQAQKYFSKSKQAGDAEAATNLEELEKFLEEQGVHK